MEKCIKCNKYFKIKDLFLQWYTGEEIEQYICKDCIKQHKIYFTDACYAEDTDITFIFAIARIPVNGEFIDLSQTLIGYHYGRPDEQYTQDLLAEWLKSNTKERINLLRQAFNENDKHDKEVLY